MARRSRRASASRGKDLTWTSVITDDETISDAVEVLDIVQGTDWSVVAGSQTATLLTIRGNIALRRTNPSQGSVFMYIAVFDKDEASPSPLVPATYVEEDILWTKCWIHSVGSLESVMIDVHVKAKRRIRSGQDVRLVFIESGATNNSDISVILRALVNKNNG